MKNKGYFIIWPQYFDINLSRSQGRRVSKKVAVKNPSITDLLNAVQALGYDCKPNPTASYPRFWYGGNKGNLSIKIEESKTDVIKKIAGKLKKLKKK